MAGIRKLLQAPKMRFCSLPSHPQNRQHDCPVAYSAEPGTTCFESKGKDSVANEVFQAHDRGDQSPWPPALRCPGVSG